MVDCTQCAHVENDSAVRHRATKGRVTLSTRSDLQPSTPGPTHQLDDVGDRCWLENGLRVLVNDVAEIVGRGYQMRASQLNAPWENVASQALAFAAAKPLA